MRCIPTLLLAILGLAAFGIAQDGASSSPLPMASPVPLAGVAEVRLDASWGWLSPEEGRRYLLARGWHADEILGVAVASSEPEFFAVYSFECVGRRYHVADREPIDSDLLMERLQQQADDEIEHRNWSGDHGGTAILGWVEAPRYDRSAHHLVWARHLAPGHIYVAGPMHVFSPTPSLHACGFLLGRGGAISITCVGGREQWPRIRDQLHELLRATAFLPGHRYGDYVAGSDLVDWRGLGFLVAGPLCGPETRGEWLWRRHGWLRLVVAALAIGVLFYVTRRIFVAVRSAPEK